MIYKNLSNTTKTFYGVTFKPDEEYEVSGCINHPKFLRLESSSDSVSESNKSGSDLKRTVSTKVATTKKGVNTNGSDSD